MHPHQTMTEGNSNVQKTKRPQSNLRSFALPNGGEEEIRTLDPHVANVMLYQLSYFPIRENEG